MKDCKGCELGCDVCLNARVDRFFRDGKEAEQRAKEEIAKKNPNNSRCLACYFYDCRCKQGLENK